ncbi:MAG: GntR family transcriptional regulator [Nocardioides sp.]|uniref:GntR family transcriptional regulator n=1 Tax=Nocardioides sp. TaxID=35761 RepID=UPI0039E5E34D
MSQEVSRFGKQLPAAVADELRQRIMSGHLRPNAPLRTDAIARDLGISVTPVREGLLMLRGQGFVRQLPRRGFVVAPLSARDVVDVFGLQADLAGELAARAVEFVTPEFVAQLEKIQSELDSALEAGDSALIQQLNDEFHKTINTVSEASKLRWFLSSTVRYAPLSYFGEIEGWMKVTHRDHHDILDALRVGDAEAARIAMREHILGAGSLLVRHLEDAGMWSDEPKAGPGDR